MKGLLYISLIFTLRNIYVYASDVVTLTVDNFEHDTQASSGATTGDWLIDFYAPWCGHCKKLNPIWEEVATKLKDDVNVAKVDVTKNSRLGSRFGVKGFPTILLLHKGKYYDYKGRRTAESIIAFAKGGFASSEGELVPPLPGVVEEITGLLTGTFKRAKKDFDRGEYFSPNILIIAFPLLFIFLIAIIFFVLPIGDGDEIPAVPAAAPPKTADAPKGEKEE